MLPARILKRIIFDPSGCWLWQGACQSEYGWISWNSRADRIHRVVFRILIGPISKDTELHHLCENRSCCNPDHLKPVTRKEHKALHPKPTPTHCKNGHPFSGNNLKISVNASHPNGQQQCRTCMREAMKRYHKKNSTGRPIGRPRKS